MAVSETKIKEQALDPALVERWNSKQELLTPGENITIENGVISAAGGEQKGKPLYFGTCTTIDNTVAKVVECEGFVLEVGVSIMVLFTYRNSTVYPTLNVNNTGAILIKQRDDISADADSWQNGDVVAFGAPDIFSWYFA